MIKDSGYYERKCKRNAESLHHLIVRAERCAKWMLGGNGWMQLDDLVSASNLGMLMGIRTFRQGHGASLGTWVTWYMKSYLRNYIDSEKLHRKRTRNYVRIWDDRFSSGDGAGILWESVIADPSTDIQVDEYVSREMEAFIWDNLNDRERDVLFTVEVDGGRQTELARKYGITKARIGQIRMRALSKLRERFKDLYKLGYSSDVYHNNA